MKSNLKGAGGKELLSEIKTSLKRCEGNKLTNNLGFLSSTEIYRREKMKREGKKKEREEGGEKHTLSNYR